MGAESRGNVIVDLRLVAARVARGDDAAFRQIVEHTRAPMYRLAARLVGDLAEAEDALQEAFVDAYRALREGRYDGRSKVETWLYRIVTNACLDALRRRRDTPREAREASTEPRFDGLVSAEARVALRELDALLAALPPQERAALVLVAVEGLPAKEAAAALGCSEGAVEQRLVRARAALRARQIEEEAPHV
ncbi:RNA polymerase sigma factor [Sorangium sp. So ce327]|jgi:RNA polymerase sigma-70 factor (ECF subfamily)|uniref:RNA polymerase sigma factor n=1 Tax=unclassified Sorangium TaxID=2621164 RepID=UPI003F5F73CD